MIIPVRCFTCGKVVGSAYPEFKKRVDMGEDPQKVLDDLNLLVNNGDKIAFVGPNHFAKTVLFEIVTGNMQADSGDYLWGVTTSQGYFPKNNDALFQEDMSITDWLGQFIEDADETYLRSFLGRMLFSGDYKSAYSISV